MYIYISKTCLFGCPFVYTIPYLNTIVRTTWHHYPNAVPISERRRSRGRARQKDARSAESPAPRQLENLPPPFPFFSFSFCFCFLFLTFLFYWKQEDALRGEEEESRGGKQWGLKWTLKISFAGMNFGLQNAIKCAVLLFIAFRNGYLWWLERISIFYEEKM